MASPHVKSAESKPYQWTALAEGDIRVITLLPGQFGQDICIRISHIQLPEAVDSTQSQLSQQELQKTLPPGWTAEKNGDRRFMFIERHNGEWMSSIISSSWTHPNPSIHPSLYKLPSYEEYQHSSQAYEALSYVWGSQKDPGTAFVETSTRISAGTISIGKNLDSALRHLRYEGRPRKLWVDAICINQADDAEKSVQVRQMTRIYRSASRVIAWLGPESSESNRALSTLDYFGNQIVRIQNDLWTWPAPDAKEKDWYYSHRSLPYGPNTWLAIYHLFGREWFQRRWVLQEIVLANQWAMLQCGKHKLPWPCFAHAVWCLSIRSREPWEHSVAISHMLGFIDLQQSGISAMTLLALCRGTRCSDARDTVIALLGVMPPKFAARIVLDYSRSLADSFKDIFLAHIRQSQRWELFSCNLAGHKFGGPSWVPDFTTLPGLLVTSHQWSSGHSRICFTYRDADILEVTGVQCATIATATPGVPFGAYLDSKTFKQAIQLIRSWEPAETDTATYITGGSLSDAYAITLIQNNLGARGPSGNSISLEEWKATGGGGLFRPTDGPLPKNIPESLDQMDPIGTVGYYSCEGRAFMVTREGYMGLGPAAVQSGDVICVVLGCPYPLVLRPLPEGRYQLVGDSFVYGLNDAIALLGPLPLGRHVQVSYHQGNRFRFSHRFVDGRGSTQKEDPRLKPHPEWTRINEEDLGRDLTGDDPVFCGFFRHNTTGELIDYDPRLLPEALEARGTQLRKFALV